MSYRDPASVEKEHLKGLRYPKFSIVYMQIFGLNNCDVSKFSRRELFINKGDSDKKIEIDKQIFDYDNIKESPVTRLAMPGFDINISLDSDVEEKPKRILYPAITVTGRVNVEMSIFFNQTVVLTFSVLVDGDEEDPNSSKMIGGVVNTDQLISLISLTLAGEHWSDDDDDDDDDDGMSGLNERGERVAVTANTINLAKSLVKIKDLRVDEDGSYLNTPLDLYEKDKSLKNPLNYVFESYRRAILNAQRTLSTKHTNFVFVDIWEDIDNYDRTLQAYEKEEDMISYIERERKSELIGLMSLYPKEWPYRAEEAYNDVCGSNIAIDTDDLIILNSSMCVVFGTYGRRAKESATNWKEHLKIRKRHFVSWPEYMLILEMILAKKYTIASARDYLLRSISQGKGVRSRARSSMDSNASIGLEITQMLLKLDAVNYSRFISHKVMFDRTIERLNVKRDEENLREIMDKINNSLSTISEIKSLNQSEVFNFILGAITVASLFEVIFADLDIPLVKFVGLEWGNTPGAFLVGISIIMAGVGIVYISGVIVSKLYRGICLCWVYMRRLWYRAINKISARLWCGFRNLK